MKLATELRRRYRLVRDHPYARDDYDYHIPCWHGQISIYDARRKLLMFSYVEPKRKHRLLKHFLVKSGAKLLIEGDEEFVAIFHVDQLPSLHELLAPERKTRK